MKAKFLSLILLGCTLIACSKDPEKNPIRKAVNDKVNQLQKSAEDLAKQKADELQKTLEEEAKKRADELQKTLEEEAKKRADELQKAAEEEAKRKADELKEAAEEKAKREADELKEAAKEKAKREAEELKEAAKEKAKREAEELEKKENTSTPKTKNVFTELDSGFFYKHYKKEELIATIDLAIERLGDSIPDFYQPKTESFPNGMRVFIIDSEQYRFEIDKDSTTGGSERLDNEVKDSETILAFNGAYFENTKKAKGVFLYENENLGSDWVNFSGILGVNNDDELFIHSKRDFFNDFSNLPPTIEELNNKGIKSLVQSKPLLIDPKKCSTNAACPGTFGLRLPNKRNSFSKRTILAHYHKYIVVILSSKASNYELAEFLTHFQFDEEHEKISQAQKGCDIAINLDGGPATDYSLSDEYVDGNTPKSSFNASSSWDYPNIIKVKKTN